MHKYVKKLAEGHEFCHPVLEQDGWWQRPCAIHYHLDDVPKRCCVKDETQLNPVIIIGKNGTLGKAYKRLCELRAIYHVALGREDVDISRAVDIERMILQHKPWAIVNTAGYVRVDDAENDRENCFNVNSIAPKLLAEACQKFGIQFITYSSDLVFDGKKKIPYLESDLVSPLNVYGQSKVMAEEYVIKANPEALIIRTSAFFGPWDQYNFVHNALRSFKNNEEFAAVNDVTISPTYVPDLVNTSLDLLLDEANGIWNISNKGSVSWSVLANEVAERSGYNHPKNFKEMSLSEMGFAAARPQYSVLTTEKGFELPSLDDALERFFREQVLVKL